MNSHTTPVIKQDNTTHRHEIIRPYTNRLEKLLEETNQQKISEMLEYEKQRKKALIEHKERTKEIENVIKKATNESNAASENSEEEIFFIEGEIFKKKITVRRLPEDEEGKGKMENSKMSENKKTETFKHPTVKNTSLSQAMYKMQEEANNNRFLETTRKLQKNESEQKIKNSQNPINTKTAIAENSPAKTSFLNPFTFMFSKPPVTKQEKANKQERKNMAEQDVYATSPSNSALLYYSKPNPGQSTRSQKNKKFDIDAEYNKIFKL